MRPNQPRDRHHIDARHRPEPLGAHGTIFVVGMSQDAQGAYHQRLHALDITTGAEVSGSPTEISASVSGTGSGSSGGKLTFDPGQYAERVGLLLLNGNIYMGWTSHCDFAPYTGWLMGYSETSLAQTSVLNLTPNGSEGSIWMSGAGLAADASGNIYFLDANGKFDTTLNASGFPVNSNFGNAFMKVSTSSGTLAVADYFEPFNTVSESQGDIDLGSGGALLLPDFKDASGTVKHLAVGGREDKKSTSSIAIIWASSTQLTTARSTRKLTAPSVESSRCRHTSTTSSTTGQSATL